MGRGYTPEQQKMQDQKNESDFRFQTNQKLQNLQFHIDMINKCIAGYVATQGSKHVEQDRKTDELETSCSSKFKEFRVVLDRFESEIKEHSDSMNESIDYVKRLYITRHEYEGEIATLKAQIAALRKEHYQFCQQVSQDIQRNTSDITQKLQLFIQEIQSKPSPIPELKKQLEDKLEMVALNGTNSVLRSTNNEKQIALIEKKIEQVFLLIKQMELSK